MIHTVWFNLLIFGIDIWLQGYIGNPKHSLSHLHYKLQEEFGFQNTLTSRLSLYDIDLWF